MWSADNQVIRKSHIQAFRYQPQQMISSVTDQNIFWGKYPSRAMSTICVSDQMICSWLFAQCTCERVVFENTKQQTCNSAKWSWPQENTSHSNTLWYIHYNTGPNVDNIYSVKNIQGATWQTWSKFKVILLHIDFMHIHYILFTGMEFVTSSACV